MALGGCFNCIKYLMFTFNFIFWLLGCALLGVGLWVALDDNFASALNNDSYYVDLLHNMAYVIIAVGAIVMVIGFLGCCGAVRESQCMLATFFIFLFLIFVTLVVAAVWSVMQKGSVREHVNKTLSEQVEMYKGNASNVPGLQALQERLKCCGAQVGASDYKVYAQKVIDDGFCPRNTENTPCADKLYEEVTANLVIIVGVAIGIGVIMLLGMIFSMMLCCAIREATA